MINARCSLPVFALWLLLACAVAPSAEAASLRDCAQVFRELPYYVHAGSHRAVQALRKLKLRFSKRILSPQEQEGQEARPPQAEAKHLPAPPGQQHEGPPEYPQERPRSYTAHNKNTDQPGSNSKPVVITRVPRPGESYFAISKYFDLNPLSGTASGAGAKISLNPASADAFAMEVDPLGQKQGPLYLPHGYEAVLSGRETVRLEADSLGNVDFSGSSGAPFEVWIQRTGRQVLDAASRKRYTKVVLIPLDRFPTWVRDLVQQLQPAYRDRRISAREVKNRIEKAIQQNLLYRVDGNQDIGVLEMACRGGSQCDGAAALQVFLQRAYFAIPTRFVGGRTSRQDTESPGDSVVIEPDNGHAWTETFDDRSGHWLLADPTPFKKDRKTQPQNDPKDPDEANRFPPQPSSTGGENESQNQQGQKGQDAEETQKDSRSTDDSSEHQNADSNEEKQTAEESAEESKNSASTSKEQKESKLSESKHRPKPGSKPAPDSMADVDQALLETSWSHTLDSALDPKELAARLAEAKQMLREFRPKYPGSPELDALQKNIARLEGIQKNTPFPGDSLSEMIQKVAAELVEDSAGSTPAANQVERILDEVRRHRHWTEHEREIHSAIKRLQGIANDRRAVYERVDLGRIPDGAVKAQWRKRYEGPDGSIRWGAVKQELHSDLHRSMEQAWRATGLIKFPRMTDLSPSQDRRFRGKGGLPFEGDIQIGPVDEWDRPEFFVRDGLPTSLDIQRLISGDLSAYQFPQEQIITGKKMVPTASKVYTYILSDLSGSMEHEDKYRARNALALAYLNSRKFKDHEVYSIPYHDFPEALVKLGTHPDQVVEALLAEKLTFQRRGNDANRAFAKAFEHLSANPRLRQVNFLWLTDGEEVLDSTTLLAGKDLLKKGTEVRTLAVNIGEPNEEMRKIVRASHYKGKPDLAKLGYLHVSYRQVRDIVHGPSPVTELLAEAEKTSGKKVVGDREVKEIARDLERAGSGRTLPESLSRRLPRNSKGATADLLPAFFQHFANVPVAERPGVLQQYLDSLARKMGRTSITIADDLTQNDLDGARTWLKGK